jgi:NADH-quinone oxidoreductase subunit M
VNNLEFLLVATVFVPLVGAGCVWIADSFGRSAVRWTALATTLVAFLLAGLFVRQLPAEPIVGDYATATWAWLDGVAGLDIRFTLGLDGLSVWLFVLSALLSITAVLVSWEAIQDRPAMYYMLLLLLEMGMLGVFAARDIILFYVFFEFTLIPLFFLIGIWGSEERRRAALKFFLYTFAGSVLTFLGLLVIVYYKYLHAGNAPLTFSIGDLTAWYTLNPMPGWIQACVFLALFAGFAIKVPLFPFHTWLPLAHVQAPAAGSVLLAGVLLKIGTYGFVRFSLPLLPDATARFMPYILGLSVTGIIYGALVSLVQKDMKRLIAYSSVSHLGFCMVGLFALNRLGLSGGLLQMLTHGLSTGGLFALVGMLYERYHSRQIADFSGLARKLPILSFFLIVFTFASIGLPGLGGFAGEFMLLIGMFQRAFASLSPAVDWPLKVVAVLSVFGVVLGAWYMLWLAQRVLFGQLHEPAHDNHASGHAIRDLCPREILALVPLVLASAWIGLQPGYFLKYPEPYLSDLAGRVGNTMTETISTDANATPRFVSSLTRPHHGMGN